MEAKPGSCGTVRDGASVVVCAGSTGPERSSTPSRRRSDFPRFTKKEELFIIFVFVDPIGSIVRCFIFCTPCPWRT